jgi:hypothetical protein
MDSGIGYEISIRSEQAFQLDAVAAITDLFDVQQQGAPEYAFINVGAWGGRFAGPEHTKQSAGNRLLLAADKLLANTRAIATCNDIEVADQSAPLDALHKNLIDPEAEQMSNVIYKESKKLSRCQPIEFVEVAPPIVIIDEPFGDHPCA